ncbi:MAG: Gfo/Idh/MocA family oxidoreductase [Bacteroidetes bacterium]|nr:Gfo/Idh/MocA family oxidoreductase [Bacteroidota bacterium]
MKKIRYGIIGYGMFAERTIAPAIIASQNSELVAVQKRSLDAAKEKAKALKIPYAFDSAEALAKHPDVDAVFIVSANSLHGPETITAARAHKHVLVEKPMAMNTAEAEIMIEECRKNDVKLMVGHMVRLSPLVIRIKELMKAGTIGKITFIKSEFIYPGKLSHRGWLVDPKIAGGGPVFDIGVHCLDTTRFLLDDEVVSVKSQLDPVHSSGRTESTAQLAIKFSRGTTAGILCSYAAPVRRAFIEVIGEKGILSAENFTLSANTLILKISIVENDKIVESREETFVVPNLYEKEVTLFSDCIINNTASPIPCEEGLKNQRVLDEAIK